jgi:hypothetical protein
MRRNVKTRISIGRIATNPTVRFVNAEIGKNTSQPMEMMTILCSEVSDNKTTYVQKKEWDIALQQYKYPPYVDCDYVL